MAVRSSCISTGLLRWSFPPRWPPTLAGRPVGALSSPPQSGRDFHSEVLWPWPHAGSPGCLAHGSTARAVCTSMPAFGLGAAAPSWLTSAATTPAWGSAALTLKTVSQCSLALRQTTWMPLSFHGGSASAHARNDTCNSHMKNCSRSTPKAFSCPRLGSLPSWKSTQSLLRYLGSLRTGADLQIGFGQLRMMQWPICQARCMPTRSPRWRKPCVGARPPASASPRRPARRCSWRPPPLAPPASSCRTGGCGMQAAAHCAVMAAGGQCSSSLRGPSLCAREGRWQAKEYRQNAQGRRGRETRLMVI
mmetsp:Transcript_69989/g.193591  ORF Transcript_69989/g.193591 Transcript_69989/m.193591 type:complete len:305 (+) Transcript_69989:276-1190(+)